MPGVLRTHIPTGSTEYWFLQVQILPLSFGRSGNRGPLTLAILYRFFPSSPFVHVRELELEVGLART